MSVFNHNEDIVNLKDNDPSPYPIMNTIIVSTSGVFKLLSNLNIHKATGPDDIPARLLKELAAELTLVKWCLGKQGKYWYLPCFPKHHLTRVKFPMTGGKPM